jgi:hypothetical protein
MVHLLQFAERRRVRCAGAAFDAALSRDSICVGYDDGRFLFVVTLFVISFAMHSR